MTSLDSFRCCKPLKVGSKTYAHYSLPTAEKNGLKGISRLPVLDEGAAGKSAAQRGWPLRQQRGHSGGRAVAQDQDLRARDRVPARARADAGLHRSAGRGRSRGDARCDENAGRRSEENQSARPRRPRLRSLGGGDLLRHQYRGEEERRRGIPAEPGALRIPQMVAEVVRQFPRGAAGHRHLPPGQSGISVADGVEQEGQGQARRQDGGGRCRLSGHAGRHRFAHHHGQWPRGARLGGRRHRGRGGHARPSLFDAAAGSHRREVHRQAQGGRDGDRPGADRHADAAQTRRGRQVRGIFRSRPRQSLDRGSRHHRQHVAGIRRDLRLLPGRRRYAALSHGYRPARRAGCAGRGLLQGARPVPHEVDARPGLHRCAQARTVAGRAVACRTQASAGPRLASRRQGRLHHGDGEGVQQRRRRRQGHLRSASLARHLGGQELRQGRRVRSGFRSRVAITTSATAMS